MRNESSECSSLEKTAAVMMMQIRSSSDCHSDPLSSQKRLCSPETIYNVQLYDKVFEKCDGNELPSMQLCCKQQLKKKCGNKNYAIVTKQPVGKAECKDSTSRKQRLTICKENEIKKDKDKVAKPKEMEEDASAVRVPAKKNPISLSLKEKESTENKADNKILKCVKLQEREPHTLALKDPAKKSTEGKKKLNNMKSIWPDLQKSRLRITNLPLHMTRSSILQRFSVFGPLEVVDISDWCGTVFVQYESAVDAKEAYAALNFSMMEGQQISIQMQRTV